MAFALRVVVLAAVMIAFYLSRGFGSLAETFVAVLISSALSHLVVLGLQLGRSHPDLAPLRRIVAVLVIIIVIGAAVLAALIRFRQVDGPIVYRTVDQVMANPEAMVDRELRLHGYLALGSLSSRIVDQRSVHEFALTEHDRRIAARFTGPVPDAFRERAEVIATGRLVRSAGTLRFEATEVIAKCPSTYQTANGPVPASQFR